MKQPTSKFTFGDAVRIKENAPLPRRHGDNAPLPLRYGEKASVFMVFFPEDRNGSYYDQFPPGIIYSVEFEDGQATDVHEEFLERVGRD